MSLFTSIPSYSVDEVVDLHDQYLSDPNGRKLWLLADIFNDTAAVFPSYQSIRHAEGELFTSEAGKDHIPSLGLTTFLEASSKLLFGPIYSTVRNRTASVQQTGFTGAVRMAFDFIHDHMPDALVILPADTLPTYTTIHKKVMGHQGLNTYTTTHTGFVVDVEPMLADLQHAPAGSVVVLHTHAHSPTGFDIPDSAWSRVLDVVEQRGLIPLFDSVFTGMASGSMGHDSRVIRAAVARGMPMMIAQSFTHSMGLFGERPAALHIVTPGPETKAQVEAQLTDLVEATRHAPACHGAYIVEKVLSTTHLREQWEQDVHAAADRLRAVRLMLYDALKKAEVNLLHANEHIRNQTGAFVTTGLTPGQVRAMRENHSIYMTESAWISLAGLDGERVDYLVESLAAAMKESPPQEGGGVYELPDVCDSPTQYIA
ncbi:Aspartate aminotransferase [Carpediemonas membranifera]|uniref:Aspartate aminotransferase n=1 Tax=Carpediemonas membranifera TaxID=201153 RepID=A0A8J6B0I5_9EUKA|nr:Aspartate aminotransferase [Carpediemonas membranifera]|eukprot:KAG9390392.1 Aspartate aminotransferase [Carpediemonas membranifera]